MFEQPNLGFLEINYESERYTNGPFERILVVTTHNIYLQFDYVKINLTSNEWS